MANQVGTAYVGVEFDRSGIRSALNGLNNDIDRTSGHFAAAGKKMGRGLKVGIAAGAAAFGVAAVGIGKSIDAASDLNEEISKTGVVFGKASKGVLSWSETASERLGLSRTEALSAAGAYGNMFKTIGIGDRPAADMSKRFVGLAADMASFHNADPSDMLDKLRSGLSGEAEPLRQYGVLLSEARVQQEAYRTGIAKAGEKLTEQQKVQARYSLILKDTAKAQGDVERTSGSFANQQRKLKAQFADLQAQVGQKFLPIAVKVITFINDEGPKAFRAVQSAVQDLAARFGPTIQKIAAALGPFVQDLITRLPGAFAQLKANVVPVAQALMDAWGRVIPVLIDAFNRLKGPVIEIATILVHWWGSLADIARQAWTKIAQVLEQNRGKLQNIFAAIGVLLKVLAAAMKVLAAVAVPILKLVFIQILPRAINVAIAILDVLASVIRGTSKVVVGFANALKTAFNAVKNFLSGVEGAVKGAFSGAESWLRNAGKAVIDGFLSGARAAFGTVTGALAKVRSNVTSAVSGATQWLYSAGRDVITGFLNGIRSMAGNIISAIKETITDKLPGYVKKALGISSPSRVFHEIGRNIGLGLAKGIRDSKRDVLQAAQQVFSSLIQAAPSAMDRVSSAFAPMGDILSRAFGQRQAAVQTPAERQLQQLQDARDDAQRQRALSDARAQQASAKTDDERLAADQAVADAEYDIQVAALQKQADKERQALDDQQFIRQQAFDTRLSALQTFLSDATRSVQDKQGAIQSFLADFGLSDLGPVLQQGFNQLMPGLTSALDALATAYENAAKRVRKARKDLKDANKQVARSAATAAARRRRRRRGTSGPGEGGGSARAVTTGLLAAPAASGGLAGPVPVGQNLARTLSRVLPAVEAAPEHPLEVRVFIGDQELRGLVRTEVRRSDDRTARLILAQSAGVA